MTIFIIVSVTSNERMLFVLEGRTTCSKQRKGKRLSKKDKVTVVDEKLENTI